MKKYLIYSHLIDSFDSHKLSEIELINLIIMLLKDENLYKHFQAWHYIKKLFNKKRIK